MPADGTPSLPPPPPPPLRTPRWGLGDAVGGWAVAYLAALVWTGIFVAATGKRTTEDFDLVEVALTYPPLWIGFVGIPIFVAATKGNGWVTDFRARITAWDVPLGAAAGLVTQLLLVPLVSLPVLWLAGKTADDLSEPARELADKAVGPAGAVLFLLIVGVGAPLAEELFYRGLVLRAFEKRFGSGWALVGSSVWFGATHFQPLQFVGLTTAGLVFGALTLRTGRLGPAVAAHMAFNLTAGVVLLWMT